MSNTKKLIDEALSLPVEERAFMADSLLKSLNTPDPVIDKNWIKTAKHRLAEIRSGKVKPIPGDDVFTRVRQRFAE
jgi:putative addiction module component (TIGR02574 family)